MWFDEPEAAEGVFFMNELSIVLGADRPDLIREETLPELFRRSAHEFPNNCALIFHDRCLTYAELDAWSDAVALYLTKKGIGRNCNVGVWWQRGLELHVIILGIVKAGATYVPVDREIPAERVEVILQEVGAVACFSIEQLNVECEMLTVVDPGASPKAEGSESSADKSLSALDGRESRYLEGPEKCPSPHPMIAPTFFTLPAAQENPKASPSARSRYATWCGRSKLFCR